MFPETKSGKHQDLREKKTNWFPEGPDIKCFVILLDFHFYVLQQQQENTLKRSEYYLHRFPPTSCCLSSGITLEIVAF